MAGSLRYCRRKSREAGRDPNKNYSSDKIYLKAMRLEKIAKMSRKRNRGN